MRGCVQEVFDAAYARNLADPCLDEPDLCPRLELTAELNDAFLRVDGDSALRNGWVAEDLAHDPVRQLGVVHRLSLLELPVGRLLGESVALRADGSTGPRHAADPHPEEAGELVHTPGAPRSAHLWVEEVASGGPAAQSGNEAETHPHRDASSLSCRAACVPRATLTSIQNESILIFRLS